MSRNMRTSLLIGVSVIALTVALPDLGQAADLPMKAPVHQPALAPEIMWWIEGGLGWTGGGEVNYFDSAFGVNRGIKAQSGFTIAGGFDYRFAGSPWHVSADVRYGKARSRSQSFSSTGIFTSAASNASHKEDHWVADFMVGRDVGLGTQSQFKLGVRVADLRATTNGSSFVSTFIFFGSSSFQQNSRFLGVGPRAALDGAVQIQGPWSIDYNGGIAVLYGNRELNLSGSGFAFPAGPFTFNTSFDSKGWVPNANGSLALGYSVTPGLKISAGYQIDYYWNALRTFDVNGNAKNIDRNYSGPFVRLSGSF